MSHHSRGAIERPLAEGTALAGFVLPTYAGGQIETVKGVVEDAVARGRGSPRRDERARRWRPGVRTRGGGHMAMPGTRYAKTAASLVVAAFLSAGHLSAEEIVVTSGGDSGGGTLR